MKQTKFFVILDIFCPFIPSPALHSAALILPNIKNWKKMKKMPGDIIIVLHKHVYHKWRSYNMWFLKYEMQQTEFFVILGNFLPFYLLTTKFWKNEKTLGDIIILRMCTIHDNHMMYGSWDMERDGQYFLSFWTVFCSFTPLTTRKIKLLKKWKKNLTMSSFYTNVPKIMIICYTIPEIQCMTDVILIFYFGLFFTLLPP